ncbi:hypothetical protein AAMO2058_001184700 [Amorphochlora amoebiformis]
MEGGEVYTLKRVSFKERKFVPICLQTRNGPCPLLAMFNILSLRQQLKLDQSKLARGFLTSRDLLDIIGGYLLDRNKDIFDKKDGVSANQRHIITEIMNNVLPKLQAGLDVNVKFGKVKSFEYTQELDAFYMLGMELFHGWVVDEESKELYNMISELSYNQLTDLLVDINSKIDSIEPKIRALKHQQTTQASPQANPQASPTSGSSLPVPPDILERRDTKDSIRSDATLEPVITSIVPVDGIMASNEAMAVVVDVVKDENSEPWNVVSMNNKDKKDENKDEGKETVAPCAKNSVVEPEEKKALTPLSDAEIQKRLGKLEADLVVLRRKHRMSMEFLNSNANQLTYCGLSKLYQEVGEGSLNVFFRNNHFAVIHKHKQELYLLVTDIAFASLPNLVWEKLNTVDGDTQFVDARFFVLFNPQEKQMASVKAKTEGKGDVKSRAIDDEELARNLSRQIAQEQELRDAELAKRLYQQDNSGASQQVSRQPQPKPPVQRRALTDEELARQLQARENQQVNAASQATRRVNIAAQATRQETDEEIARRLYQQDLLAAQQASRAPAPTANRRPSGHQARRVSTGSTNGSRGQPRQQEGQKKKCAIQ